MTSGRFSTCRGTPPVTPIEFFTARDDWEGMVDLDCVHREAMGGCLKSSMIISVGRLVVCYC